MPGTETLQHFKDARLDELATFGNVAQFVSFGPDLRQRFSRMRGVESNRLFPSLGSAISALLERSPERRINIRSFKPDDPQGHEFIYGIESVDLGESHARRLTSAGLYVIVNETIDVNDGGVSGVVHGNLVEFAPGETPRVVETGRIVSTTRDIAKRLLETVYGFTLAFPQEMELRVEFSIHPVRRGFADQHTVFWEMQEISPGQVTPILKWPNAFSELIGDKAFGLLFANAIGLPVPRSTVISRNLEPFAYGDLTGNDVKWLRTCPRIPEPGFFPTVRGWTDPFRLMQTNGHERLASILVQDEVSARFSGALLTDVRGEPIIEGVIGFGDDFMLGRVGPAQMEPALIDRLRELHMTLARYVGGVRAEWAFDGQVVWLIQLQQEAAMSSGQTIVPGEVGFEHTFDVSRGLSGLRELVELVRGRSEGIKLIGNVGMTSHIADVLRRNKIPSRIIAAQ